MVKLFSQTHTFHHPFANVTSAFWRKYPNELAPHVKAIDCYDRTIDPKTGNLIVHRILSCETAIPSWMSSLGVSNTGYVAETTVVNSEKQKMVVRSRNITGSSIMAVEETCTYTVDRHNSSWTHYRQQAKIMAFMPMLKSKFENYSFNSMAGKSQHGLIAIESLCQRIGRDGLWSLVDEFIPESAKQAITDVQHAVTTATTTATATATSS